MKKRSRNAWLIVFLVFVVEAMGQTSVMRMSLDEALIIAQENNWEIKKVTNELKEVVEDKNSANAVFLPNVEVSYSANLTNDPLASFGFKLQQESVTAADFNPALLNDPENIENYNAQLMVQQPLINADGWAARKAAKIKVKAVEYKGNYTKAYVKFLVKKAYYTTQLANAYKAVITKALKTAESALSLSEDNMKQGYIKEVDVMSVKVRVLELQSQIAEADDRVASAGEYLAFLINQPNSTILPTDSLVEVGPYLMNKEFQLAGRSDVLGMEMAKEALLKMHNYSKLQFAPRLNAFGMVNYNDNSIAGTEAKSWMVGAKLQWSLFAGGKNIASVKRSKVKYIQAQNSYQEYMAKSSMDLNKAKRGLEVASAKLKADDLARKQSEELLRIRLNRYKQGVERTTDLLMAETTYAQKELIYLNTIYSYNVAVFYLELLMQESGK